MKKRDKKNNKIQRTSFFQKNEDAIILTSSFLLLTITVSSICILAFDTTNPVDVFRYVTKSSWSIEVDTIFTSGSVQFVKKSDETDSLIAWSDAEVFFGIQIFNMASHKLTIDSISVYSSLKDTILPFQISRIQGYYEPAQGSLMFDGNSTIAITLNAWDIKENYVLLTSLMRGAQKVKVFSNRGSLEKDLEEFVFKNHNGQIIKHVSASSHKSV